MEIALIVTAILIGMGFVLWRPPFVLAPIICMFGIEQFLLANFSYFRQHGTAVNYGIGVLVLLALMSTFLKGGRINYYWPPVGWLMLALYGLYALSTFWSIAPQWNAANLSFAAPYILVIALAMPMVFRNLNEVRLGLLATLILATVLAFMLLFGTRIHDWGRTVDFGEQVMTRYGVEEAGRGNPLALADLGASIAIIAMIVRLPAGQTLWVVIRWVAIFAGMALIFRSGSRGQYVGLIISILICYKFSRPKTNFKTIIGLAASIGLFILVVVAAMAYYGDEGRYSVAKFGAAYGGTRGEMCKTVLSEWITSTPMNYVVGLGGGACWQLIGIYPHVVPIEIIVELGFVGLSIYLTVVVISTMKVVSLGRMTVGQDIDRTTVATLATLLVFHFVMGFKQGTWLGFHVEYFLVILISRMEWQLRRERRQLIQERTRSVLWNWDTTWTNAPRRALP